METKMIIDLVKLPSDEKVEINSALDPKKLEIEFDDLHYKSQLAIHGFAEKIKEVLMFSGILKSLAQRVCGRCLEERVEEVEEPFDLVLDIKGKIEIDVTDDLREVMIVSHPLRFLCSENCKGLCPGCGENLNTEKCKCSKNISNGD